MITNNWKLYQKGIEYNDSLEYVTKVQTNERFVSGDQWKGVKANGLPTPVFNIIKRPLYHFIAYLISSYLHTIIHEAGHLVFGLLSGYKFVSFRIGNIMLIKIKNKLKFKKFSLLGTAGQCLMEPPKLIDNKVPNALYNLGGVLMNLIVSMITIILIIIFKNYPLVTCVLEIFALIGIYYAALNGTPLKLQINNDGMNTISLKKHPESQKSFWIQLMMNAEQTKGKRIKDMPNNWFYFPTDEQMKNSLETTIGTLYCNKLLDEHKFEETKNSIIKLLKAKLKL